MPQILVPNFVLGASSTNGGGKGKKAILMMTMAAGQKHTLLRVEGSISNSNPTLLGCILPILTNAHTAIEVKTQKKLT